MLVRLARKCQKFAAIRGKRVTFPRLNASLGVENFSTSSKNEGHFVVYSNDRKRFVLPLKLLNHKVVQELFKQAEEEFGLPNYGPLTLPCDARFVEYVMALIQNHITKDVQKALLMSISSNLCSSSLYFHQKGKSQQPMICSF